MYCRGKYCTSCVKSGYLYLRHIRLSYSARYWNPTYGSYLWWRYGTRASGNHLYRNFCPDLLRSWWNTRYLTRRPRRTMNWTSHCSVSTTDSASSKYYGFRTNHTRRSHIDFHANGTTLPQWRRNVSHLRM